MTPASVPPALAPSIEEAYRRKCLQLKQRTNEVEEANDAARLRLSRLKRQVEKLRVERAFLLEQLAKRTSTNVEDSEGSPSPPPTVRDGPSPSPMPPSTSMRPSGGQGQPSSSRFGFGASGADNDLRQQPKDKPLRTKRGHRKPSLIANMDSNPPGSTFINQNLHTLSPSSDTFSRSHSHAEASQKEPLYRTNGVDKPPKKPSNAFELYCHDTRPNLPKEDGTNVEEELARGWKDLSESHREEYQSRHDKELDQYQKDRDAYAQKEKSKVRSEQPVESQAEDTPARDDEDVVMGNYDTETQTPGADAEE